MGTQRTPGVGAPSGAASDPYEAELRPWNFVMIGLVFLALLVTATSTAFFTRAICAEVAGSHG